jgi:hypothetical protein
MQTVTVTVSGLVARMTTAVLCYGDKGCLISKAVGEKLHLNLTARF